MKTSGLLAATLLLIGLAALNGVADAKKHAESCLCGGLGSGVDVCRGSTDSHGRKSAVKAARTQRPLVFASESAINQAAAARIEAARMESLSSHKIHSESSHTSGKLNVEEEVGGLTAQDLLLLDPNTPVAPKFRPIGDLCQSSPANLENEEQLSTTVVPAYPGKPWCRQCHGSGIVPYGSGSSSSSSSSSDRYGHSSSSIHYGSSSSSSAHASGYTSGGIPSGWGPCGSCWENSDSPNGPYSTGYAAGLHLGGSGSRYGTSSNAYSSGSASSSYGSSYGSSGAYSGSGSAYGGSANSHAGSFGSANSHAGSFGSASSHAGSFGSANSHAGSFGPGSAYGGSFGPGNAYGGSFGPDSSNADYNGKGPALFASGSANVDVNEFGDDSSCEGMSFAEQEKIYNGHGTPSMPADAVSVTLAYKSLTPQYNPSKKRIVPEDHLSFGHRTIPVDGSVHAVPVADVPEEKLQIVDKPIVELKAHPVINFNNDDGDDGRPNGDNGAYITYSDLGYGPVGPSGNQFIPAKTEYAATLSSDPNPEGNSDDDGSACGPLGPPLPDYRPGGIIVTREHTRTESGEASEASEAQRSERIVVGCSGEDEDSSFESSEGSGHHRSSSGQSLLGRLWKHASHHRGGCSCNL